MFIGFFYACLSLATNLLKILFVRRRDLDPTSTQPWVARCNSAMRFSSKLRYTRPRHCAFSRQIECPVLIADFQRLLDQHTLKSRAINKPICSDSTSCTLMSLEAYIDCAAAHIQPVVPQPTISTFLILFRVKI